MENRIRTTHVGSLVRPPDLIALLTKLHTGEHVERASLDACVDVSVKEVVAKQRDVGVDIVSDGEFAKAISWAQYVTGRLGGVELRQGIPEGLKYTYNSKDRRDFAEFYAEYEAERGVAGMGKLATPSSRQGFWTATAPITYNSEEVQRDIRRLKAATQQAKVATAFLPVVAPVSAVAMMGNAFYKSQEEFLFAVADALHEEYQAIVDAGLYVQIDDAFLASNYDGMVPPLSMKEYREWAHQGIEALNHALRGIPEERVRYHVCWGSWNGPHSHDVPVAEIVDLILGVKAGAYSLEMANPRHEHEWLVWKETKLPAGKSLLPGVVTHSTYVVEHPDLVCERIVRLANLVGPENVIASTDCGFSQGPFARRVHPSIQWAKLAALAEGSRLATAKLWKRSAA